jgi:hypothetical protein
MPYEDRIAFIRDLEAIRQSKVISYITSDRQVIPQNLPGFSIQLTSSALPLFIEALGDNRFDAIDLFLYTRGGETDSVWPLVSLLRECCNKFSVIVPFRCHSAGTMICLGADEVILLRNAELSPIDPTTGNPFNPTDPVDPRTRYGISVEDVAAFFELAKTRAHLRGSEVHLQVLKELTDKVHPLALGNVQRVYMQIRRLAQSLLELHLEGISKRQRIPKIIRALTEKFYSHIHAITPREAIPLLGEWVRMPTEEEERAIRSLFNAYVEALNIYDKFCLPDVMGDDQVREIEAFGGIIEGDDFSNIFETTMRVVQTPKIPNGIQFQGTAGNPIPLVDFATRVYSWNIISDGWRENDGGI